ncbi:hypothetical protein Btru_051804 [Bulinus truncatus]|nr:hypothetical protein Btru_051804 [Bulinus truncatus]
MDRWLPKGSGAPPLPPSQSDGAFERFLTAAIATIITIMFSWRLLDKINDEDREDELAEEERRRRVGLSTFSSSSTFSSPSSSSATPTFADDGAARPGIGYQTTTLKPIIRIPVDLPLDGEEEKEETGESPSESIYRPVWGNTVHQQARSHREGNSTKLESKHAGEPFDHRATDRYELDRQHDNSFDSNAVTEGTVSSTETLLVHSHLDSEPEHSSSETEQFVDSSAEDLGGDGQHSYHQQRQLQLNVSTDSSSGGANSSKEEYRNILDDENYQPYRDSFRDGDDKYSDRDSDDEFLGISDGLDTDYSHDDIQPRELDSDEELFCCSVLEPIIEEDSDEITTSSDSTNSSRSGKACYESRHREHEYDLEYEERKHGLLSDRGQYQIRSRGHGDYDSGISSLSSRVSDQHVLQQLGGSRPSTAVPSRRPVTTSPPHLPGRTRDLESSRLNDVNTAAATGPDDQVDTVRRGSGGARTQLEERHGGIDALRAVSQPPFQETDLDASDSYEDNSNFPSQEDYVKYIRSYGSSVDRLTGKLNRPVRRDNLGSFPHSQSPSDGITDTNLTFPASPTGHHVDQVVPDKFIRTLTEDSNSESDESAQTVITRQTSAESGDSPVHGPTFSTLRPSPVKTKRPLSDGIAYANKKLRGEEDKEEAYFRDRYVSEGGAPAFGEEGREQDDEDDYGGENNNNKYDLRAYKSYAALDSAGLGSPEHARKEPPAQSVVLTLSEAKWDIPEIRDENSLNTRDLNENCEFDQQGKLTPTETIDSEETFLPCENKNVPSDELRHPGDFKFVYSQFSREDDKSDIEVMDSNEYWSAMTDESLGSRTREHEDSEEWEERIVEETFVVPMTPERAILRTLQSVKELLDKRSEIRQHRALGLHVEDTSEVLDDECQSTCTSTMIEVDGYGAAGFETYDALEEDFPEQSDAMVSRPLTNVDIKSKLGFHLNLDEYKTTEYSTDSGWPIVRLIEKERVYVDEDGHDEHQIAVTVVDSGEEKVRGDHHDEEMETNIDDDDDEEESRQNDADESEGESEDVEEEEEEEEEETSEESEEEISSDGNRQSGDQKKEEIFAFVECKEDKLIPPFASLETPVLDKRTHSQRTYLEQEGFAKLELGDVKSPAVTGRPKSDFRPTESASTPDSYTPVVRAEMRTLSPPPIEMYTPKQLQPEALFSPSRKSSPPPSSSDVSKNAPAATITMSKTVQSHSISGFETEPKKLIDFDQPCDPFDDFNTFLSGIPAASESVIEEDYDSFVRHIAEKDEAVEILEQDSLKTPLSAAGILSGNLASPYMKQEVFSFPGKEQVRPVPLARKHSLRDKKPEVKEEETAATGEPEVKKATLKRTSTAQSEEDFGLSRRSSVGDEESTGVMNRSFEETSSQSFALERYDSEPGVSRSVSRESLLRSTSREGLESPSQDMRMLAETHTRHFLPSRPLSGVSLEPLLDVVLEVPIPPQDAIRSGSSSSAEPTTPATPSATAHIETSPAVVSLPVAPLPTVFKTPSPNAATEKLLATPTRLEPSPVISPPPPPTVSKTPPTMPVIEKSAASPVKPEPSHLVTPPPVKWTRVIPGSNFVDEKLSPNTSVNIAEELQKKLPDTPERKLISTMTSPAIERPELMDLEFADAEEDGPELFSPSLSIDRLEIKIEESPKIRPILQNNVLSFSVDKKLAAIDSHKSEKSEETDQSESEYSDESDTSEEYEDEEDEEMVSDKVSEENKTNVDNNDNLVREKRDKEKESVAEKVQEETLHVKTLSHSMDSVDSNMPQDSTSASVATSPGTLSSDSAARSMTLPLTIPFRGMAWAHSQFGQAPAKPRTMKEIKKKFKPYKSVLTQGPPPTTPTTPTSPKITPFVLPDHLLTPSRLKIIQSRNRFLSEQNLNSDVLSGEFEARKESMMQNAPSSETAPSTPAKERKYTPKNLSTSSKYRSQEQLEKIMNMINMTRKSESNLHTAHTKCLHSDCIFTEKGRRDIMDKALSIDNIHSDLYSQLQKLDARDYLDFRGMGDAFFPETNSDLFDLTFPFQDDRRQVLDRPASMSELRHASDYTTISGSGGGGLFDTPTSRSGKNRFANRQYKKSKSLCTLETNIDDDHFATSPTDDNLQRVPSVHELRISKSLQKLNVPNWYKQSSLSKSGSCLLKYGSSSTMSSWQMSPSLISSPCTTPSAMSNVVIKTRVQPPTSARNLRSPRYPSKSAPTTPSFANQSFENGSKPTTPTPVKLPSEQLRSKEKPKSLMPIPIVPFDKIRAMFEKKKEEAPPSKREESPAPPTSPVSKPQTLEGLPSPKTIGINGSAEEDDLYDDVVPKVIVSPTDPNVKSILKRPGQEKRYSDIVESPELEEEPIILRPVPTRPSEAAPTLTLPSAPVVMKPPEVVLVKEEEPVIKPPSELPKALIEDKPVIRQKPIPPPRPKSSEIKPMTEVPVKKPEEVKDVQKSPTKAIEVNDPTPIAKPKGFSLFRSFRSSSSSSSEDVKTRKSPISPTKSFSPDSSYESDKFPASPAIRVSPTDRQSPPSINVSPELVAIKEEPKLTTVLEKPLLSAHAVPKTEIQRTTKSPDHIQETNIDDSFEDAPSPRHEPVPERTQSPPQVSEPEKKRSWFAKPKLSKSKSPTEVEKSLPKSKLKVSELQSKFEVPEFAQEPRRLTSSRTSSVHNESFASNESEERKDRTRSPVSQPERPVANAQLRSPVKETDLDKSVESSGSRLSTRSRDLGVDYSILQRKPSDSDSSFARDSDKREPDRGVRVSREERHVTRESDVEKDSSFSSRDEEDRYNDSSDRGYDRRDRDHDRRNRDYDRRESDRHDRDYDRRDVDRRDRDYERRDRDYDRRDRDYDRRDVDRRDRDYDRRDRDYDRRDRDYDKRDVDRRDRDYDRRDRYSDSRDRDDDRSKRDSDSLDRRRAEKQEPPRKEREWSPRDRHQEFDTSRASSRDMDTSRDSRTGLRRPSDNDDTPKLRVGQSQESLRSAGRTWQPKPRGSRSSVSPQASDISPTKPVDSNGTSTKPSPYRYPVPGSAFSASKPNTAAGLNTPPLSRHDGKSSEAGKSLKANAVETPPDTSITISTNQNSPSVFDPYQFT